MSKKIAEADKPSTAHRLKEELYHYAIVTGGLSGAWRGAVQATMAGTSITLIA